MKRLKKTLAVVVWLMLLLALCIPALSLASAEGEEQTIVIPISKTTDAFNGKGESAGTLNPGENGTVIFQPVSGEEIKNVVVCFEQTTDGAVQIKKLIGKVKVTLTLAEPDSMTTPEAPDASAVPATQDANGAAVSPEPVPATPEAVVETPSALPESVWIDVNVVVSALVEANATYKLDNQHLSDQIAALQPTNVILELTPSPTMEENIDTPDDVKEPLLTEDSVLFPIAGSIIGLLILGSIVWIAISAFRVERHAKDAGETQESIQQQLTNIAKSLNGFTEKINAGSIIDRGLFDSAKNEPYLKRLVALLDDWLAYNRLNEKNKAIQQSKPASEPQTKPEEVPIRQDIEVLRLANNLAGVASAEDWKNMIRQAGFRYIFVQANTSDRNANALQEDMRGNSILACLMKNTESEVAYLIPSFEDPSAGENRWKDFYTVTDDPSVKYFRIDELTVMKVLRGTFYIVDSKGKLSRRT